MSARLLILVCVWAAVAVAQGSGPSVTLERGMQAADAAVQRGEPEAAVRLYHDLAAGSRLSATQLRKAHEEIVAGARALLVSGALGAEIIQFVVEARKYFRDKKDRVNELYATDTLAVGYQRAARHADAVALYLESRFTSDEFGSRPALLYNYGRALEQNGLQSEAFAAYLRALSFPAVPEITAAAAARTASGTDQIRQLTTLLWRSGRTTDAIQATRVGVERFASPLLVQDLVRFYTAAEVSLQSFVAEEESELSRIMIATPSDRVRNLVREIIVGYRSPLAPGVPTAEVFPDWVAAPDGREALSDLLTEVGTQYSRRADAPSLDQAWQRQRHAWNLAVDNPNAVTRCLGMVHENPALDRDYTLTRRILVTSVGGWLSGRFPVSEDREQLQRLEGIFAQASVLLERVGPVDGAPTRLELSKAAADLEEKLQQSGGDTPPRGNVFERHGLVLMETRDFDAARRYLHLARANYEKTREFEAIARCDTELADVDRRQAVPAQSNGVRSAADPAPTFAPTPYLVPATGIASHSRRKKKASIGRPFAYYLLVLSYAPDFCERPGGQKDPRECGTGRHVGFVVHGLWLQGESSPGPENCGGAPVASSIVNATLMYIPTAALIQHEWAAHGTCSGLSAADYFAAIRKARDSVKIPADLDQPSSRVQLKPSDIEAKLAAANPSYPKEAFRTSCYSDSKLQEIRVCLNKDLSPRDCGSSAGECRANTVSMSPVR